MELEVDPMPGPDELSLSEFEGVVSATGHGDVIEVTCTDPSVKVEVVKRVDATTTVTDIVSEETDLEQLFNQYTTDGDHAADEREVTA